VTVDLPEGRRSDGNITVYPRGIVMMGDDNNPENAIRFEVEDLIMKKTITPIPSGGAAVGFLSVLFPGLTQNDLHAVGTTYTVEFTDISGQRHYMHQTAEGPAGAGVWSTRRQQGEF
jgi:hypothetical protein